MKILQRTVTNGRWALCLNRHGVRASFQRPKVGGGYYIHSSITVPWPWIKVN